MDQNLLLRPDSAHGCLEPARVGRPAVILPSRIVLKYDVLSDHMPHLSRSDAGTYNGAERRRSPLSPAYSGFSDASHQQRDCPCAQC